MSNGKRSSMLCRAEKARLRPIEVKEAPEQGDAGRRSSHEPVAVLGAPKRSDDERRSWRRDAYRA